MTNQKKVLIYTTQTCPFCIKAKEFMKSNDIEYTEIDVSKSEEKMDEMLEKSGMMSVPIFDIEGTIIDGITGNEDKILQAVKG